MLFFLDKNNGEITDMVNAEGKEPWHRFSPDTDYRFGALKPEPHDCHPNFVFKIGDDYWVTPMYARRCGEPE